LEILKSGNVEILFQIRTFPHFQISRLLPGVEALDDFVGEVQAGMHVGETGLGGEDHVEAFFLGQRLDDRDQPLLKLALELVLQVGDLGLGVAVGELDVALQLVDVLVELRAGGVAHHADAGVALVGQRLQSLTEKKQSEVGDKNKQLQALTTKRDTSVGVMNDAARAQLDKDIDKLQRDIQFTQQNAQAELQDLQNDLQGDFQKKLIPIIEELAKEKGLYMIFTAESGFAYVHPGLNLSDEVIKRLDAKK